MDNLIYLDNNATTKVDEQVLDVMLPFLKGEYANPSSMYDFAKEPSKALREARKQVQEFLGAASEKEIFYCLETQKEGEESQYFLWHYNYDTKENGCMRTLERRAGLYTSDMYLLLKEYNGSGYVADAYF